MMPKVHKIFVFPIKSLDGVEVESARITAGGALQHDREFAIYNLEGKTVNGKKYPSIHQIRTQFDLENRSVTLNVANSTATFHLDDDRDRLNEWFSDYFQLKTEIRQNLHIGFPDDDVSSGPTIIGVGTLRAVQNWFPTHDLDNIRRRFRVNIEVDAQMPFWEDWLYDEPGRFHPIKIGGLALKGTHPCARCAVPSRDPLTGEVEEGFQKRFSELRAANLPGFAERSQFNHFYKLSVNTIIRPTQAGKIIHAGDEVVG